MEKTAQSTMELPQSQSVPLEPLPETNNSKESLLDHINSHHHQQINEEKFASMSDEELTEKCEALLTQRIKEGDKQAYFQLGQVYFESGDYEKARKYFERAPANDWQAQYQLGVIYFDGLGLPKPDYAQGILYMKKVATSKSMAAQHLIHGAEYNIGRAYFQGYGIRTDYHEAERWWNSAADDGNPNACVRAQGVLGMFYSRADTFNLKRSFFWHSEACGNGNLESQGALGVMYMHGMGVKKSLESAFECLSEAGQRGNVYAMGHMIAFYYNRKLYTKCVDMASRVSQLKDVEEISAETNCQENFIRKGISMACFYYARCLDKELGIKNHQEQAKVYYSRAYEFDPDTCASLQNITAHGKI